MAYFSNATEGGVLDRQCAECQLRDKPCPTLWVQLNYNYEQIGNDKLQEAMTCLIDGKGLCKTKPLLDETR